MELIYIYIDQYRIFNQKEFKFSDKFNVTYDPYRKKLSITENLDYVEIYKNNIVGISAIVGKNASGKTSLLSLIGDKIDDRWSNHEIFKEAPKDPFKKFSIFSDTDNYISVQHYEHSCEYFLLYYIGQDNQKRSLFVMETNSPQKYSDIFEKPNFFTNTGNDSIEKVEDYYEIEKGWLACVFYSEENATNRVLCNTKDYKRNDSQFIQESTTVIYFQKDFLKQLGGYEKLSEEENCSSIKKRYARLQARRRYQQLLMLQGFMKKSLTTEIYKRDQYQFRIILADAAPFFYRTDANGKKEFYDVTDVIINYRDGDFQLKTKEEKVVLDFLEKYVQFTFSRYLKDGQKSDAYNRLQKIKQKMPKINRFDTIKETYLSQLNTILRSFEDQPRFVDSVRKAADSYLKFLEESETNQIDYEYKPGALEIELTKDSKLDKVAEFFDDIIDEPILSNIEREASVFSQFIKTEIFPLSEGENENLAMFTSISEQIDSILPYKKNYILLFDEIERAMHPEMCRTLISDLIEFLGNYQNKSFQIIIASHSPFIVGDIRKENLVTLLPQDCTGQSTELKCENSFAQNIHTLLKSKFFLNNTFSQYAVDIIRMIDKALSEESLSGARTVIWEYMDPKNQYPGKLLPSTDSETLKYLKALISSIGEPLIRHSLEEEFDQWCKVHPSKEMKQEELECLRRRITELEADIND